MEDDQHTSPMESFFIAPEEDAFEGSGNSSFTECVDCFVFVQLLQERICGANRRSCYCSRRRRLTEPLRSSQ